MPSLSLSLSLSVCVWKVAKHNTESDCWIVLGEPGSRKVYRIEKYLPDHPGGPEIVLDVAGGDAHQEFEVF
jgi:cytochrome b involved in lipid metabolism